METGFNIDGSNSFEDFGVFAIEGGLNELLAYPPLKAVAFNDWHEEDGIDADLSAPRLAGKEFTIKLGVAGALDAPHTIERLDGFLDKLREEVYHEFQFPSLGGRTYRLRLVAEPSLSLSQALGFVTLKLAEDAPMKGYEYLAPNSSVARVDDYLLDGKPFTDYGVRVTAGTLTEFARRGEVKEARKRDLSTRSGVAYDRYDIVKHKSHEAKMHLHMRASSMAELWRNYDALLYDLHQPEARRIKVRDLGDKIFRSHYKSAQVSAFYPDDQPWLDFTLTLVIIGEERAQN